MAAMAQDVLHVDIVLGEEFVEPLPEVGVPDRLETPPLLALPALAFPVGQPLADALGHILAVGDELHAAAALERGQPLDHAGKLHAVVGRLVLRARGIALLSSCRVLQDVGPAARARIAAAGPVREQPDQVGRCPGIRFHDLILQVQVDRGRSRARTGPAPADNSEEPALPGDRLPMIGLLPGTVKRESQYFRTTPTRTPRTFTRSRKIGFMARLAGSSRNRFLSR